MHAPLPCNNNSLVMYEPKLAPAHGKGTGPKGDPKEEAVERVKQSLRNKKEKKAYAC